MINHMKWSEYAYLGPEGFVPDTRDFNCKPQDRGTITFDLSWGGFHLGEQVWTIKDLQTTFGDECDIYLPYQSGEGNPNSNDTSVETSQTKS